MADINWPEVLAGFVIGLLPLVARQAYILLHYSRLPSRRKFLGHFWVYHRSTIGDGKIYGRQIDVRYSLTTNRLTFRAVSDPTTDTERGQLTYSGRISTRQGMVRYFSLRDVASHERISWYIIDPFFDPFDITSGLYLALDLRGLPAAGPLILSRTELGSEEVERRLENHVLRVEPVIE